MKIIAALRVKNEARWIREVLASIHPLTRDIAIFDDHSTDGTPEICAEMGASIIYSPYPENDTNETRDKNLLLEAIRGSGADWVLSIDGDEVLERGAADKIRAKLLPGIAVLSFPIRYVWNDRQHYRADGVYAKYQRASMFALQPDTKFSESRYGCNFHCGNIPLGLKGSGASVPADILHLGYMHREDRVRKFAWYNKMDPNNTYEDGYKHMVLGDLEEYPATMKRVHGGPLQIFSLPKGKWPDQC